MARCLGRWGFAVTAVLALIGTTSLTRVAVAEAATFTSMGTAPGVRIESATPPFQPRSTETVTVTVTDRDTLRDIETVRLSVYGAGGVEGAETQYDSYTMTYTNGGGSFGAPAMEAADNGQFVDQGSTAPTRLDRSTGTFKFNFTAPDIMRQSSDWVVKVAATDHMGQSRSDSATDLSVSPFQTVTLESTDGTGTARAGEPPTISNTVRVVSNHVGHAQISVEGSLALNGRDDAVQVVSSAGSPGGAQVKISCGPTPPAGVNDGTALVPSTATSVRVTRASTVEVGQAETLGCALWNGDGVPRGAYQATLLLSVA